MTRDAIDGLVATARRQGHDMPRELAGRWHRTYGFTVADEMIEMAARLVRVAQGALAEPLQFTAACTIVVRARRDYVAAATRLGLEVAHARAVGNICDAGDRHGIRIDATSAALRLARADGDADVAISRIERRARNRRLCQSHFCRLRDRSGPRAVRIDAAAWCRCRSCFPRLCEELTPYTRTIVERHCRRHCAPEERRTTVDELREEAPAALYEALLDWPDGRGFSSYYGGVLANQLNGRLRSILADKRGGGQRPLSLDEPRSEGRVPVTLADCLPNTYSVDPLLVVLLKEAIAEARATRSADVTWIAHVYELLDQHA